MILESVFLLLFVEGAFAFYLYLKAKTVNYIDNSSYNNSYATMLRVFDTVANLKTYSVNRFIKKFFLGCNTVDVRRDNMLSFLSWAVLNKKYEETAHDKINKLLDEIETKHSLKFKEGNNTDLQHISMSVSPVIKYKYQPLMLYLTYNILHKLCNLYLKYKQFKRYNVGSYSYLYREGLHKNPTVFFHGVSAGWYTYLQFILHFDESTSVILFELEPFRIGSLDFTRPKSDDVTDAVKSIVKRHNFESINIVGHSFGTCICSWMIKKCPDTVKTVTLIDPVNILLCTPHVAYNFLYKEPTAFFHRVIRHFASNELTVAHSMYRNFSWIDNILFLEDVPKEIPLFVSLSYGDEITPTKQIVEQLTKHNIPYIVSYNLSHAESMINKSMISKIHKKMTNLFKQQLSFDV